MGDPLVIISRWELCPAWAIGFCGGAASAGRLWRRHMQMERESTPLVIILITISTAQRKQVCKQSLLFFPCSRTHDRAALQSRPKLSPLGDRGVVPPPSTRGRGCIKVLQLRSVRTSGPLVSLGIKHFIFFTFQETKLCGISYGDFTIC